MNILVTQWMLAKLSILQISRVQPNVVATETPTSMGPISLTMTSLMTILRETIHRQQSTCSSRKPKSMNMPVQTLAINTVRI